jgi:hypothetical protein
MGQLDDIRRQGDRETAVAVDTAKKWIFTSNLETHADGLRDPWQERFVRDIVVDYIIDHFPAGLIAKLRSSNGWTADGIIVRRDEIRHRLMDHPRTQTVAVELRDSPDGRKVKLPKLRQQRPTQVELTYMAVGG